MSDDVRFSVLRRKLLAGLGTGAIRGVTGAQESKSSALVPWILAFEVNDSMLIRHLAPLFERLFGGGSW